MSKEPKLAIEQSFGSSIKNRFKGNLNSLSNPVKKKGFFAQSIIWFFIFIAIINIVVQNDLIASYFDIFPQKIPLLKSYVSLELRLISREHISLIPYISTFFAVSSILFASFSYKNYKTVAILTTLFSAISTSIITISVAKLIQMYI